MRAALQKIARFDITLIFRCLFFRCVLGFALPVVLVLQVAPIIFSTKQGDSEAARARQHLASPIQEQISAEKERSQEALLVDEATRGGMREIASDATNNPLADRVYLLSVAFRARLPQVGVPMRIASKFTGSVAPYPGWALALYRHQSSIRPAVYWQGASGKGGWFSFGEVNFSPDSWYSFTLVSKPGEAEFQQNSRSQAGGQKARRSISVFWQKLGEADASGIIASNSSVEPVHFLGGFDVGFTGDVATQAPLRFGAAPTGSARNGSKSLVVSQLLLAQLDLPHFETDYQHEKLNELFSGGPQGIASHLGAEDIVIYQRPA